MTEPSPPTAPTVGSDLLKAAAASMRDKPEVRVWLDGNRIKKILRVDHSPKRWMADSGSSLFQSQTNRLQGWYLSYYYYYFLEVISPTLNVTWCMSGFRCWMYTLLKGGIVLTFMWDMVQREYNFKGFGSENVRGCWVEGKVWGSQIWLAD